ALLREALHAPGRYPVALIVRLLHFAAARGHFQRLADRVRLPVRVKDDPAFFVPGRAAGRLDEARLAPKESLLVRVQDRNERDLRKVQPLPQEVDSDEDVEIAQPE